jgi:hypothetical protein
MYKDTIWIRIKECETQRDGDKHLINGRCVCCTQHVPLFVLQGAVDLEFTEDVFVELAVENHRYRKTPWQAKLRRAKTAQEFEERFQTDHEPLRQLVPLMRDDPKWADILGNVKHPSKLIASWCSYKGKRDVKMRRGFLIPLHSNFPDYWWLYEVLRTDFEHEIRLMNG